VARANLEHFQTPYCLVGHTHIPLVFREDDGHVETLAPSDGSALELDHRRVFLNPGSVGQPRDGDSRACGMLLDTEARSVEWRRVEYPIEPVQVLMETHGLPRKLIERLAYGW
jgi:diadenosine tetraphosphatase ApaH/serine/threonine PP2A family protein phosphatase